MSRVPKQDIEALKAQTDIAGVIGAALALEKRGNDLCGRCPFHPDDTPSLVVTPAKGLWHCFGCGAGGDVIEWVRKKEGVSFRHAVELLKAKAPLSSTTTASKKATVPKLPSPVSLDAEKHEALAQVAAYYHATLKESPEALAYLESRGIASSQMIEHFQLGYANRTLGLRLPQKNRVAGEKLRGLLFELGVYRQSGHEHLAGSLVVPLFDETGRVVSMYGRKINDHLRPGTPLHLYLPGPHRGVLNARGLPLSKEVILCEAPIDALTFWCAGFPSVTTSYGTEGFTDELMNALKRHQVARVLIAYDRDDAGERAAEKLRARLEGCGLVVGRVLFPKGMDANEYAQKVKPAEKSLGLCLERARNELLSASARSPSASKTSASKAPSSSPPPDPPPVSAPTPSLAAAAAASTNAAPAPAPAPASNANTTAAATAPTFANTPAPASITPAPTPTPAPARDIDIDVERRADELVFRFGDRRYRVRGFDKNTSRDVLKVNVHVSRSGSQSDDDDGAGGAFHVDTLDLYAARFRAVFMKLAAAELSVDENVIKKDLGKILLKLEELQDEALQALLGGASGAKALVMTADEEQAALELLRDPKLLDRVLADFERCGVVGEETNKLVGYLAMTSRMLDKPLAIIIQSSSAAGKSSLMEAILSFCPDEEKTKYSAMTGQSLFYMSDADLKHKVLAVVEEEGAERASYSLKLLQSEGELIIASTGKDPQTGRMVTSEYRVEGPVMLFLTTTAIDIDEELLNRCLVLSVDEDRQQTRAIHRVQRERRTLEGRMLARERKAILHLHENAQRLLKPIDVVNPYAARLTFLDDRTRARRDHMKYLTLIETVALVHQHQREHKRAGEIEYIEVTLEDIALANELAHRVLGSSLDELPPQTRKLLEILDAHVAMVSNDTAVDRSDVRLTRRALLDVSGLSLTQLRVHLGRLVDLEHVVVHAGGRGQSFVYELVYDGGGKSGAPHLPGLIDVDALRTQPSASTGTTATWRGDGGAMAGSKRRDDGVPPARLPPRRDAAEGAGATQMAAFAAKRSTAGAARANTSYAHVDAE